MNLTSAETAAQIGCALLIDAVVAAHKDCPLTSRELAHTLGMPVYGTHDLVWVAPEVAVKQGRLRKYDGMRWSVR